MFRTVLIPIDGSPFAARALPVGIALATAVGADVRVVGIARNDAELAWTHTHVFGDAQRAGLDLGDVEVRVDPRPVDVLLDLAPDDKTVLCLAAHDRIEPAATMLHSVGSALIERARRPLVVVGPNTTARSDGDVVVALDPCGNAEPVLAVATAWATQLRRPLRIVTVYEPVPDDLRRPGHYTRHHGPPTDPDIYLSAMRERVADVGLAGLETVAVADPVSVGSGLEGHLRARPAQLLVLGGGHRDHPTLSPGVARHMVQTVSVPLLLVNRTT